MESEVKETCPRDVWAIVEVMGHSQYAGRVSEYAGLGVPLVRGRGPAGVQKAARGVGDFPSHALHRGGRESGGGVAASPAAQHGCPARSRAGPVTARLRSRKRGRVGLTNERS
jgi:hypothetical protein